ncbi:MAG: hypothetical protein U1F56_01845 [Rubrivivax sp.]
MPVLIEALSVVVSIDAINVKYAGGWPAFVARVPNRTLCFDAEIARVGFMSPADVRAFVDELESFGLQYLSDGMAQDIAVVDQLQGFLVRADWLETAVLPIDGHDGTVVVCRLAGSIDEEPVFPDRWKFQDSMSQRRGFMSEEEAKRLLRYLRTTDDGVDVFLNESSGEEVFIGRTSRHQ